MKDPAFLFYSNDFYEGTRLMLPEERACYIDLLCYQHQHGIIPDNAKRLSMYCSGINEATVQSTLEAKFIKCEKGWYNKKLEKVVNDRKEYTQKQSENGTVGQYFKKLKASLKSKDYMTIYNHLKTKYTNQELYSYITQLSDPLSDALALLKHLENEDVNENENRNKDKSVSKNKNKEVVYPFDSEEFKNMWELWKDYRIKKDKFKYASGASEQAALKTLNELANGNELDALKIINNSLANGWKGFFKLKEDQNEKREQLIDYHRAAAAIQAKYRT